MTKQSTRCVLQLAYTFTAESSSVNFSSVNYFNRSISDVDFCFHKTTLTFLPRRTVYTIDFIDFTQVFLS